MLLLSVLVVALHEVGEASSGSSIEHLLAVLRVTSHQLIVMLLLLKFVVEGLELLALVRVSEAIVRGEDRVYVLSKGDLGAKSVHKVSGCVVIAVWIGNILQADIAVTSVSIGLGIGELVEVRGLLILVTAASISHGVSL